MSEETKPTLTELKALAYDTLAQIQEIQKGYRDELFPFEQQLLQINQEIAKKLEAKEGG